MTEVRCRGSNVDGPPSAGCALAAGVERRLSLAVRLGLRWGGAADFCGAKVASPTGRVAGSASKKRLG